MNVLVCIPCLLTGGTEIQTLSLVGALVGSGHSVCVACYFEYAEAMAERYRAAGAQVELLSEHGIRPAGVRNTAAMLFHGFRRIVRSFRPDAAHVQYMAPGALPVIILRMLGVRKIIATAHTGADIYSAGGLRVIRFLTRHVLTAFQCITLRAERSFFGASRLFDGKISSHFTIYNNIPAHIAVRKCPKPTKADGESCITVGVVSRLEEIKGMDLVVPAFAIAANKNANLRLLVVGDGSQRALMERQAREASVGQYVQFVGRKPQPELQDYYDRIDILLMPSRSEGFGLTALEGMARGCVPVVADTGGLPEVVTPDCGLLHRPEDVEDMAEKIIRMSDNEVRHKYSEAGRRRACVFTSEKYKTCIADLYNSI